MRKPFKSIFIIVSSIFLLTACTNSSFKKESHIAKKEVKAAFNNDAVKKPTSKSGNVDFYLPFGFEIKEKFPNNTILQNGSKTYILFINHQESTSSEVVYKATVGKYKNIEVNETFKKQNKFGYVLIHRLRDDNNELTVGIGGRKITTETKTANLKEEAIIMMKIVNSVRIKK